MSAPRIGIAMVGYAFMGATHSVGWRQVHRAFDVPLRPEMVALAGRNRDAAQAAADRLGWSEAVGDWRTLLDRDDVDVIDIVTPGDSHAEIALAALAAGKHVICEKPLANTVVEAEAMAAAAAAAAAAGVRSMVGFNYRRLPATALARRLIAQGRLGRIHHVRAVYLQDWILDPAFPLVWRLQAEHAGSGALGDLGAHIIDLAQYLIDDRLAGVAALTETFVRRRPLAAQSSGLSAGSDGSVQTGEVTVDDAALFLGRFTGGAVATFEATRFAAGRKNGLKIEINGSKGSLVFDLEALFDAGADPATSGFRRILATEPDHPYVEGWWPPGHLIGYEHSFTHEFRDFLTAVAAGEDPRPSFADGLQVQQVLDAVTTSARRESAWQKLP